MKATLKKKLCDYPVIILNTLIRQHTQAILWNYQKLRDMLKDNDKSGRYQREIYLLITALKVNVPLELLELDCKPDFKRAFHLFVWRIRENFFIEEWAAQWAVSSWAKALDIEIQVGRKTL